MPFAPVVLPGDGPQVDDLQVLAQGEHHLVDVGELVALGVHAEVVGVALQHPGGGVSALRRPPRGDHRQVRVQSPVGLELEQVDPVVELALLHLLVQLLLGRVLGVELFQVVGRRIPAERAHVAIVGLAAEARGTGQDHDEHPVGILELPPDSVGVDLLQLGRPVLRGQIRRGRRHQVLVPVQVLEPEHEVVGGEGLAVAPLHSPAQVDGERLVAVAELPALGGQGRRLGAGHIPVHEAVVTAKRTPADQSPGPVNPRRMVPPYRPISCTGLMTSGSSPIRSLTGGSLPAFTSSASCGASLKVLGNLD